MAQSIGTVTILHGQATAAGAEGSRALAQGAPVYQGDTVTTGPGSAVEIHFLDKTVLAQGADSKISLDEYAYNPDGGGSLAFKMAQGTFRTVTGQIADKNPEAFQLKSPLATIGIRGTEVGTVITFNDQGAPVEQHAVLVYDGRPVIVFPGSGQAFQVIEGSGQMVPVSIDANGVTQLGDPMPAPPALVSYLNQFSTQNLSQGAPQDNTPPPPPPGSIPGQNGNGDGDNGDDGDVLQELQEQDQQAQEEGQQEDEQEQDQQEGDNTLAPPQDDTLAPPPPPPPPVITVNPPTLPGDDGGDTGGTDGDDTGEPYVPPTPPSNNNDKPQPSANTLNLSAITGSYAIVELCSNPQIATLPLMDWTLQMSGILNVVGTNWDQAGQGDLLMGSDGANSLEGLNGNDTLLGLGGNDLLIGGQGDDSIDGGADNDTLYGGTATDTASTGNDYIEAGAGNDAIYMAKGLTIGDSISGGAGSDTLYFTSLGGAGHAEDLWNVADVERIVLGATSQAVTLDLYPGLLSEDGVVTIDGSALTGTFTVDGSSVESFDLYVIGGSGNNILTGGCGDDTLQGGASADTLTGNDGNDYLLGNGGADSLSGGADDDTLNGGAGADSLEGGQGDNLFIASTGNDTIYGGEELDTLDFSGLSATALQVGVDDNILGFTSGGVNYTQNIYDIDAFVGTVNADSFNFMAASEDYAADGRAGNDIFTMGSTLTSGDTIVGGLGTDTLEFTDSQTGTDELTNVNGIETITAMGVVDVSTPGNMASDLNSTVTVNGSSATTMTWNASLESLTKWNIVGSSTGVSMLYGGMLADTLVGGNLGDLLEGGEGNDVLTGNAGNDSLKAGTGNDSLSGGIGDDTFYFFSGQLTSADTISGGTGEDSLEFSSAGTLFANATSLEYITLTDDPGGNISVTAANALVDAGQTLTFDAGALNGPTLYFDGTAETNGQLNVLSGSGDDTLKGGALDDTLVGGEGNDSLLAGEGLDQLSGGDGEDYLNGQAGNDQIQGEGGHDVLYGGAGDDLMDGGDGNDLLYGQDGDDSIDGGEGDDIFFASAGFDSLNGGDSDDFDALTLADTPNYVNILGFDEYGGYEGVAMTTASDGAALESMDSLLGGSGSDTFSVAQHQDYDADSGRINGGGGNDFLYLQGESNDAPVDLRGFESVENIVIHGQYELDIITGEDMLAADQTLTITVAQDGWDPGVPSIIFHGGDVESFHQVVWGTESDPMSPLETGGDVFYAGEKGDTFYGLSGADTFQGGSGDDWFFGGDNPLSMRGLDVADYSSSDSGIFAALDDGMVEGETTGTDHLSGVEAVIGTLYDDTFYGKNLGDSGVNYFEGLLGDDEYHGGGTYIPGDGGTWNVASAMHLNQDDDGSDPGFYVVADMTGFNGTMEVYTTDGDVLTATQTLSNIQEVMGSSGADVFTGDNGVQTFAGLAGNDTIDGGEGVGDWDDLDYAMDIAGVIVNLSDDTVMSGMTTVQAHRAQDGWGFTDTITNIEEVHGSFYADYIKGDTENNYLQGLAGDDTLIGGGGQDWVSYCDDAVRDADKGYGVIVNLSGGAVTYWDGTTTAAAHTALDGWGDTDTLTDFTNVEGSEYADLLVGDGNNNFLWGSGGGDALYGGAGNDSLEGEEGDDTLEGGEGNDSLMGGDGFDIIDYSADATEVLVNLSSAVDPSGYTIGAYSAIDGDEGLDTLIAIEGVQGSLYNDTLIAGDAGSWIDGNLGSDTILGGAGEDTLSFMSHSGGVDVLDGAATFSGDTDTFTGIEVVQGSAFDDTIVSTAATWFSVVEGMAGDDDIDLSAIAGGTVSYEHSEGDIESGDGVFVNLSADFLEYGGNSINGDSALDGWGGSDALAGIENIIGSALNDCLMGDAGDNLILGRAGDDALLGSSGGDTLDGGAGTDWVSYFNTGAVFVNLDSVSHSGTAAYTAVHDASTNHLVSIEGAEGSDNADTIFGSSGANWLDGLAGNDSIDGLGGNDTLVGEEGNDILTGGAGTDMVSHLFDTGHGVIVNLGTASVTITGATATSIGVASGTTVASLRALDGADGLDTLSGIEDVQGSQQNDYLVGSTGNNLLTGVTGTDTLLGGAGADTFYYSSIDTGIGVEDLTDFVSGTDKFAFASGVIGDYATTAELQQHVFTSYGAFEAGSGNQACLYQSGDALIYDPDGYSGASAGDVVATGVNSLAVTDVQVMDGAHHVV